MILHPVRGRNKHCGPAVIAGLTGMSTDAAAGLLRAQTGRAQIKATTAREVIDTLRGLNYWVERFQMYPKESGAPTLGDWLTFYTAPGRARTWLIATSKHWQIVSGEELVCSKNKDPSPWRDLKKKWLREPVRMTWAVGRRD